MGNGYHAIDWTGDHVIVGVDSDGWLAIRTYGDSSTGPIVTLNPEQVADLLATLNAATVTA